MPSQWSKYLLVALILLLAACRSNDPDPSQTLDEYVIMVSFDGFRWDYPELYDTPHMDDMASQGVKADRMIPSFPTKTFPNHYTLATGLYPDNHGIINNSFYAPDLKGIYRIGDRNMVSNPDAYFGEPIWVTAEEQGVKSASYFWVGSEAPIKGIYPSYWKKYNESIPYRDRIDQVIKWLKLPLSKRPGLIMLYFDEPDHTGHDTGPVHPETGEVIEYLDSILGYLRSEIKSLANGDRVNLILLSDHGMGAIIPEKYVNISSYMPEYWIESIVGGNPVYLVDPAEGYKDSISMTLNELEGVMAWQKEGMPEHLHYGNNPRFPGLVVVADSGWSIGTKDDPTGYHGGAHGYDQTFSQMHTIFYAEGPAFKKDYTTPAFSNVEVYGIISHVLGLESADNDGNLSNVSEIFAKD
ncbi:MAG: ectonucleotide pyrophosphatase/phosphodiesterase [Bacteroidota bacterium]